MTCRWLICLLPLFCCKAFAGEDFSQILQPNQEQLLTATAQATEYLLNICDEDGRFIYLQHLSPEVKYTNKYNLLRHAGTMYALAMRYEQQPDDRILQCLLRARNFLQFRIEPVPQHPEVSAVWTDPEDMGHTDPNKPKEAKLGGAALVLIALCKLRKIQPEAVKLDDLHRLAAFIILMQRADGGFNSKYDYQKGPDPRWESLYYPGEAMLGLMLLYEQTQAEVLLLHAARGMAFLAQTRKNQQFPPADHWALLATARMLPYYSRLPDPPVPETAIVAHMKQICTLMLGEQIIMFSNKNISYANGCFDTTTSTCRTAIRLEGLLASYTALPDSEAELKAKIVRAAGFGTGFLLRQQIREGKLAGGIPRSAIYPPRPAGETVKDRSGEVRIDYVQHAMSALIRYRDILGKQEELQKNGENAEKK
jgi:hypothetical protein